MKKIVILFFALSICITSRAQSMDELYSIVINDCYNRFYKKSNLDTMYISTFSPCSDKYFGYEIRLNNEKIVMGLPNITSESTNTIYKLNYPELDKKYILISLGVYSIQYIDNEKALSFLGALEYKFEYNRKKEKYELMNYENIGL